MKRLLVSALGIALAASISAAPQEPQQPPREDPQAVSQSAQQEMRTYTGTITRVDHTAKALTLKDASGKEFTFSWNDSTKLVGDLKEGSAVSVQASGQGDRMTASAITVSAAKKPY
jgi:Cu/Ag efflux protein CusF